MSICPVSVARCVSTRQVYLSARARFDLNSAEKFISELAWRDYWQQVWIARGDEIDRDLLHAQPLAGEAAYKALVQAQTGIEAVDEAVPGLKRAICTATAHVCRVGNVILRFHWQRRRGGCTTTFGRRLGGNALSWQWVAAPTATSATGRIGKYQQILSQLSAQHVYRRVVRQPGRGGARCAEADCAARSAG